MNFSLDENKSKYFKLFACCFPVKGALRSTICDSQRGNFHFITNDLYDILQNNKLNTFEEIFELYEEKNKFVLLQYFNFLLENEYIFVCGSINEVKLFPDIDKEFDDFRLINNAILERDINSTYDLIEVVNQLSLLGCKDLDIRYYNDILLDDTLDILNYIKETSIENIRLYLPYYEIRIEDLRNFLFSNLKLDHICFSNSPESRIQKLSDKSLTRIIYTTQIIKDNSVCGQISPHYFTCNLPTILEGFSFNTCLNKKITVDIEGNIKNCPSTKHSLGNIENFFLAEAITEPKFKTLWSITKSQVEVCKDCEFRLICTDCRAHLKDSSDIYSKPSKCTYDPYIAVWGNE